MSRSTSSKQGKSKLFSFFTLLLLAAVGCGVYAYIIYFEGEKPLISLETTSDYLGVNNSIEFSASDTKSGLKLVVVTLTQGETVKELVRLNFPRAGKTTEKFTVLSTEPITIEPKKLGFKDGPATLSIEAEDHSFRGFFSGNTARYSKEMIIDTSAPKIHILHSERYIQPGGSGIFISELSGDPVQYGLNLNGKNHPSFALGDGRDNVFITYFGLPYDAKEFGNAYLYAIDKAGNETKVPVSSIFKPVNWKHDTINITDGFLNKKIPEFSQYYPEMQGTNLEQYLFTNNDVRISNNKTIASLCDKPSPERMWEGTFVRMAGASRANFADHRTYYYEGKPIDKQVHLGIDIASTRRVDIKAANTGIVVHADYLGIYGNMIMIDHGQGVYSLYSHLSQINVSVGERVQKGFVIGQSGTSGMAGGDHLHFSMLVNGIFVNPKEWIDPHWINVTIDGPITDSKF